MDEETERLLIRICGCQQYLDDPEKNYTCGKHRQEKELQRRDNYGL